MKFLLIILFSILTIPVYGEVTNYDLNSTILLNSTNTEEPIVSTILDQIPGIQFNQNGTISLNVTINTIVKLQAELDQCELEDQPVDKCQLLSLIYTVLEKQYVQQSDEIIFNVISIIMPIFTGLAGLYFGRMLTDEDRKKRQKKDLEKIQRLINLDFSRIYYLNTLLKKNHENMHTDLQKDNAFEKFVIDKTSLTQLMRPLTSHLKFYHWATLENSASLIKLEPDAIQKLQFAHDQIFGVDQNNNTFWLELASVLESSLVKIELEERPEFFKKHVDLYFESLFVGYSTIDNAFKQLDMDWLDLNLFLKEYPKEKEKLDESLLSEQKQDTPEYTGMSG